jgi:hypothetical protein
VGPHVKSSLIYTKFETSPISSFIKIWTSFVWMDGKSRYALHRILNIPKTLGKKMTWTQIHARKSKINNIPIVLSP